MTPAPHLSTPDLTLLVLPPATDPATAHKILVTAGQRDNIDSIDRLLAPTAAAEPSPAASDFPDSAVRRWEVGDGPVY